MDNRTAVVPGTFDPITNGHVDIIKRAQSIFDHVIVAVATNSSKIPLFNFKERLMITREVINANPCLKNVEVKGVNGLLVDFAKNHGAKVIVRGLRAVSDFEYELQMAFMNRRLNKNVEIMYMMPYIKFSFLSSSIVKEIFYNKGDISQFVPEIVIRHMKDKLKY